MISPIVNNQESIEMIIAVSGGHEEGDDNKEIFLDAAKEQGAVQVFGKPIEKEKLLRAIREIL